MTNITTVQGHLEETKKELSVIVAIRNEEDHIERCLDSLIEQDLSHEKYEIIVVDGMSDDKTRELLDKCQTIFPSLVRTFDNPEKIQSVGRNIGIKNAKGKAILIFSGHACAHSQLLSTLINELNSSSYKVAGVGGIHLPPKDETGFGKVMADVQMSFLGGGGTSYRQHKRLTQVDTIAFCVYKKDIIEEVGLYDEKFHIAEDVELNRRIRKAGFNLMVCPQAITYYYRKHSSLKMLWKRMFLYGVWRTLLARKHPDSFGIQFFIPVIIIIGLAIFPVMIFLYPLLAIVILTGLMLYFVAILTSSLSLCIKRRSIKYLVSIPIYAIEHFGIGLGSIVGLFKHLPKKRLQTVD